MPAKKKQEKVATDEEPAGSDEGEVPAAGVPVTDCADAGDEATTCYRWTTDQKEAMVEFLQDHDVFYNKAHKQFKNTITKMQLVEELGKRELFKDNPPTFKQVKDFLKNYRDRYQRIRKKKSGQASKILTAGDNWILANFQFLSKHIRQTASVSSHAFADLGEEEEDDTQDTQDTGSDSELGMPTISPPQRSTTSSDPRNRGMGKNRRGSAGSSTSTASTTESTTVLFQQLLHRAEEASDVRKGKDFPHPMSSHEATVKAYGNYLMTQMVHVPPDFWMRFTNAVQEVIYRFTASNPPPVAPLQGHGHSFPVGIGQESQQHQSHQQVQVQHQMPSSLSPMFTHMSQMPPQMSQMHPQMSQMHPQMQQTSPQMCHMSSQFSQLVPSDSGSASNSGKPPRITDSFNQQLESGGPYPRTNSNNLSIGSLLNMSSFPGDHDVVASTPSVTPPKTTATVTTPATSSSTSSN